MDIIKTKPVLFQKTKENIWTDPYIQNNLLKEHLNPFSDGASRNMDAVERTVNFIQSRIKPGSRLLDLGCGPGIYAEWLTDWGHSVTGIDINTKAIEYARNQNTHIKYIEGNYITDFPDGKFDAIIMIYCDMGTHSDDERDLLLKNCFDALEPGGKLIFDVFDSGITSDRMHGNGWEYKKSGFWAEEEYLLLKQTFHYPENKAFAYQYNLILKEDARHFIIWERYYSEEEIIGILWRTGFRNVDIQKGLLGRNTFTSSSEMFIVAEK